MSSSYETIGDGDEEHHRRLHTSNNNNNNGHNGSINGRNKHAPPPPSAQDGSDHDDDDEIDNETVSAKLTTLIMVAAATAATLGYDVGIMAAAIQPLEREMGLSGVQKEVAMGSLNFIAAAGAMLGGKIANAKGRKPTVAVCSWLFVVGTVCMAAAPNYGTLLLGRIVTGMGVGVSFVVAPVYLSEVAPTSQRGALNTIFDVAINGGILLGYVVGFMVQLMDFLSDNLKWRTMLGMGLILPAIVLINLTALPESPRWLVMANQSAAAGNVLQSLGHTPRQILRTVSSIEDELQSERQSAAAAIAEGDAVKSLWHLSPGMRLVICLGFWQQITGTEAVLYYSADFLKHAGLRSATQRLLGNVFVGLCKLTPELVAMQVVDRIGRRPLMLGSAAALMTSTGFLSAAFYFEWSPLVVVVLLCAVMASFSIGLGPFTFLVASESLGLSERAAGVTLCAAANRFTSGLVALTAVSLYEGLGNAGLFGIYATVGALSLPFYSYAVPETAGQTLEELAAARAAASRSGSISPGQSSPVLELRHEEGLT